MEIIKLFTGYECYFDYKPNIVAELKKIHGAYFNATKKCWVLPKITLQEEIDHLRFMFPNLSANNEIKPLQEIQPLPELSVEIPLKRKLFHYQEQGVAYNILHQRTLIGDDMGLGKTMQAVATVVALNCKCTLVVCPASVKTGWVKEFEQVAGWKAVILNDSIKNTWTNYTKYVVPPVRVFVTNYESMQKYFVQKINMPSKGDFKSSDVVLKETTNLFDCVIFDESHKLKESKTKIARFALAISNGKKYRFCLTGTPIQNKLIDILSQLAILGFFGTLGKALNYPFGTHSEFKKRFCDGASGQGNSNERELGVILQNTCYYRRLKSEVKKDMPPIIRNFIYCEIDNRKDYNIADKEIEKYLREKAGKSEMQINRSLNAADIVAMQKCLELSAIGKIETVFEKIEEVLDCGEKYVLFATNKAVIEKILQRFPKISISFTGDHSQEQREKIKKKFQEDETCQLIVISMIAGGTGLDGLQHVCSRGGFIQLPWTSALLNQCESRLDRTGQTEPVQFDIFIGENTRDTDVWDIIAEKQALIEKVFDEKDPAITTQEDINNNSLFNKTRTILT